MTRIFVSRLFSKSGNYGYDFYKVKLSPSLCKKHNVIRLLLATVNRILLVLGVFQVFAWFFLHKSVAYPFFTVGMVMVGIACAIGIPLAVWAARLYLQVFAYRIEGYGWAFAAAVVITFAIAFATVLWQTLKAARTNPVESLKNE